MRSRTLLALSVFVVVVIMPRLLSLILVASAAALAPTRRQLVRAVADAPALAAAPALARDEQLTRIGQEAPVAKPDDIPFTTLRSGVKVKTLRPGGGDAAVTKSSTVFVEATGRLLNLNGVTFYSTKNIAGADSLGGAELKLALGSGGVVPGLEEGLVGARKNEIRRIIVPSELGYSEDKAAMEPNPPSVEDRRALDSVLRNPRRDAAILFDVKVVRIK